MERLSPKEIERRFNAMWNVMAKYHASDLKAELDATEPAETDANEPAAD